MSECTWGAIGKPFTGERECWAECSCGWMGPKRASEEEAYQDLGEHRKNADGDS